MKIMYFTNKDILDWNTIPDIIKTYNDEVMTYTKKPTLEFIKDNNIEFIVSDRARSLITKDIIDYLPRRIINLHPSFLPWNRGYNPNYWAIKEQTPCGVTIHYIDEGIDTGDILSQIQLCFSQDDTLKTTYDRLRKYMVGLFQISWYDIKTLSIEPLSQNKCKGTFHYKADFDNIYESLIYGWNTKVKDLDKIKS